MMMQVREHVMFRPKSKYKLSAGRQELGEQALSHIEHADVRTDQISRESSLIIIAAIDSELL